MNRIYFRADGAVEAGAGHIMRCLALANEAKSYGVESCFVGGIADPILKARVENAGHALWSMSSDGDQRVWLEKLQPGSADWVVLDGYSFGQSDQAAIKSHEPRLLVVDDMNAIDNYHCDIILNQNLYAPGLQYSCGSGTTTLLGARYALMREQFSTRDPARETRNESRRLLVTLGASDSEDVSVVIVTALAHVTGMKLEILLLASIGSGNGTRKGSPLDEATTRVRSAGHQMEICPFTDDMPGAMAWADAGLIAAGSTSLEAAYMGLPCLAIALADNQIAVAKAMHTEEVAESLGWHANLSPGVVADRIETLFGDSAKRKMMSRRGQCLVDGQGAKRVVETMLEY